MLLSLSLASASEMQFGRLPILFLFLVEIHLSTVQAVLVSPQIIRGCFTNSGGLNRINVYWKFDGNIDLDTIASVRLLQITKANSFVELYPGNVTSGEYSIDINATHYARNVPVFVSDVELDVKVSMVIGQAALVSSNVFRLSMCNTSIVDTRNTTSTDSNFSITDYTPQVIAGCIDNSGKVTTINVQWKFNSESIDLSRVAAVKILQLTNVNSFIDLYPGNVSDGAYPIDINVTRYARYVPVFANAAVELDIRVAVVTDRSLSPWSNVFRIHLCNASVYSPDGIVLSDAESDSLSTEATVLVTFATTFIVTLFMTFIFTFAITCLVMQRKLQEVTAAKAMANGKKAVVELQHCPAYEINNPICMDTNPVYD